MNSPIRWLGGKRYLKKHLVSIMPPHINYIEVFSGALWVLLEKEPSKLEIFNDINGDLINFYKVIQDENKYQELINKIYYTPSSRELFDEYDKKLLHKDYSNDIDRAFYFYYLLKLAFGGNIHRKKRTFAIHKDGRKLINRDKFIEEFVQLHERIKHCYIENKDYQYILKKYDSKDSLFFCDPPYLDGSEELYSNNFNEEEYKKLKETLSKLKGKFILTTKKSDFTMELFKEYKIEDVSVNWGIQKGIQKVDEIIVTNYSIESL